MQNSAHAHGGNSPVLLRKIPQLIILFMALAAAKYGLRYIPFDWYLPFLFPTTKIVALFTGLDFTWIYGAGFINSEYSIAIEESCSGLNFFLICTGIALSYRVCGSCAKKAVSLALAPIGAYGITILANAARIIINVHLLQYEILKSIPESLHKIIGILVFFSCIIIFNFIALQYATERSKMYE
jgi:exosortase K